MRRSAIVLSLASCLLALGCGHSEEEWQAQLKKYQDLSNHDQQVANDLAAAKKHVADLEAQLKAMGANVEKQQAELADRDRALAEYKARAAKLEAIKARFDLLRHKLAELTKIGLEVHIHRNRMVISLPGDVLFDTGKDSLKKDGQDILMKVANVIRGDRSLVDRDYQVAGHTDSQPLQGGVFKDNWGLSLMRAREVLVFLVQKGGLPRQHWAASGYADTDPVASNATKDGQQKNRRCDLVVVPEVDEMLDLKAIAQ